MRFYHTVADRDNPDQIETEAPFLCGRQDAWLGRGYYLWEQFEENAHWWGSCAYGKDKYVIVQFEGLSPQEGKCFDLCGNMEHIQQFSEVCKYLKSENLQTKREITASKVIAFMREKTDFDTQYDSIRAKDNNVGPNIIKFQVSRVPYMDLCPRVQLCLFAKSSLNLSKGKIIYPEHYVQDVYI